MLKFTKLNQKLVVAFLAMSLIPLLVFAFINLTISNKTFEEKAYNQLESIREIKKLELSNYISSLKSSLMVLQSDPYALESFLDFDNAFNQSGLSGKGWLAAEKKYAKRFINVNKINDWYDLFFINLNGDIIFTAAKESDLGVNIPSSALTGTSMGDAFTKAKKASSAAVVVSDFTPYPPSNNEPAGFMMAKMLGGNGEHIGYVALQFPLDKVNALMQQRSGMGETGETYLVGEDKLMRSDSFLDPENYSVIASFSKSHKVDTDAVRSAFNGESANRIITDYNGNSVLSSFTTVNVGDFNWAIIAEIDEAEAFAAADQLIEVSVVLVVGVALIIVLCAFLIAKSISEPIVQSAGIAQLVANGDLTNSIAVTQNNELGILQKSMQDMIDKLKTMIEHISSSAMQQSASSEKLAVITEQTNQNMVRQHGATDQVATAMTEMSSSIEDVSNNTAAVSHASDASKKLVEECALSVRCAVDYVDELSGNIEGSKQLIEEVQEGTSNIVSILDVIKNIADQTNLLALNAAIEAARAGDEGRGFSVVADEVRTLAQNTQNSTVEIETMIQSLVVKVKAATESMNEGFEQAQNIVLKTQEVTQSLNDVAASVNKIVDMNAEIAHATQQQSEASKDISMQTLEISDVSDATGKSTKEIMETSKELMLLSSQLTEEVNQFKW